MAAQTWFREKGIDPAKWNAAVASAIDGTSQKATQNNRRREFKDVFNAARNSLRKDGIPRGPVSTEACWFQSRGLRKGACRSQRSGAAQMGVGTIRTVRPGGYNGRTPQATSITSPIRIPANRMTVGELEQTCVLTGGDPFGQRSKGVARRA